MMCNRSGSASVQRNIHKKHPKLSLSTIQIENALKSAGVLLAHLSMHITIKDLAVLGNMLCSVPGVEPQPYLFIILRHFNTKAPQGSFQTVKQKENEPK